MSSDGAQEVTDCPATKCPYSGEMQDYGVPGNFFYEHRMDPIMYTIQGERHISVGTFQDNIYVKIREYTFNRYTNKLQYTKKGINLTLAQWQQVKALIPYIDKDIQRIAAPVV